eukprot:12769114-Ditylum_brightwellii.AAC.1
MCYSSYKVVDIMQHGSILIATDGSTSNNTMSFTWKICDSQGKTLVYHAGPAFEYVRYKKQIGATIYLDSEGVIKRIPQQKSYSHDYLFHTIDPDWNVFAQICKVLGSITVSNKFIHIKSHQDDDGLYKELDLPAQ